MSDKRCDTDGEMATSDRARGAMMRGLFGPAWPVVLLVIILGGGGFGVGALRGGSADALTEKAAAASFASKEDLQKVRDEYRTAIEQIRLSVTAIQTAADAQRKTVEDLQGYFKDLLGDERGGGRRAR